MRKLPLRLRERFGPADRRAVAILVALPILLDVPWALAGRPILDGDNLTQNYPLRVLTGELLRHGRLPLWNPDIWSGTPLLAGWNAGAMFPGTWLFAILPGVAAWEVNMVGAAILAGVGMHLFLRRIGCTPLASLLGSLTFTYTGFMSGQSAHIGLFEGTAFAPWMLLAIDWLVRSRATRFSDTALPVALLGVSSGLVVLAGDPRAISNDAIAVGVYLIACCVRTERARRRPPQVGEPATLPSISAWRLVGSVLAAAVLAAAVACVQWLPGLSYLHQSQRAVGSLAAFGAGSLHFGDLGYLFVPFLYGGNGNYHMPVFAGSYNLPELTYGTGLLPLVALFVLTVMAFRHRAPGVTVWLVTFLVGAVLSAGTNTPLGHLLVHLPLYGGERLQNRNSGVSDLALSVLLAIFVDLLEQRLPSRREREQSILPTPRRGEDPVGAAAPGHLGELGIAERAAGLLAPAVAVALVVAMYVAPVATERWLGAGSLSTALPVEMTPYYVVVLAVALAAGALVVARGLTSRQLRAFATAVVVCDVVLFLAMASYQPAPRSTLAASNPAADRLAAAAGRFGRTAIFDPQQLGVHDPGSLLGDLGRGDLVILHHLASVQGYGSAVAAAYEAATATHEVENLRPSALLTPTFDELDLRAIVTLPELIGSVEPSAAAALLPSGPPRPAGTATVDREPGDQVDAAPYPPSGPWRVSRRQAAELILPGPLVVDEAVLRFEGRYGVLPGRAAVTLLLHDGSTLRWAAAVHGGTAAVRFPAALVRRRGGAVCLEVTATPIGPGPRPTGATGAPVLGAAAVHVLPSGATFLARNGPPRSPTWFALNGLLQGLLPSPRWTFEATIGPADVFVNHRAYGPAWLEAPGARSAAALHAPGRVRATPVLEWQEPVMAVDTPRTALLVRSEQYVPGWTATIQPLGTRSAGSQAVTLPVERVGLLQGVELPPGQWRVTWHYGSRRVEEGLAVGAAALLVTGWLVWLGLRRRRLGVGA